MEQITPAAVENMSRLGRLRLRPEEVVQAAEKITSILQYFATIQNIDTKHTPPADDVTGLRNVWRVDEAQPAKLCSHEQLLELAPDTHGRHVRVKAVFSESSQA